MLISYASNQRLILAFLTIVTLFGVATILNPSQRRHRLLASSLSSHGYSDIEVQWENGRVHPQLSSFWSCFATTLRETTPHLPLPPRSEVAGFERFVPGHAIERPDLIKLEPEVLSELTNMHALFVDKILQLDYPQPPYLPGSSGVVTSAGGQFLPDAIVLIRLLRRTGSKLPVEVYFQDEEEFEPEVCDTVLKELGAECHVISRILESGNSTQHHSITHYQVKAFAMLFSRFDNILWLDADELPLFDPARLFESEPYTSQGFVSWPDYWYPTSSDSFYKIAGIETPDVGLRASSETGQFMIKKSKHLHTLELAAYYNYFGPSHYYPLLSQGSIGEGDKETFLAAAQALRADYWAVQSCVGTIGFTTMEGSFRGVAILQAEPSADLARSTLASPQGEVPIAFIHNSRHKPNAGRLAPLWKEDIRTRMFGQKDQIVSRFGEDLERTVWDEIVFSACNSASHLYRDWVGKGDVCAQAIEVFNELFKDG